MTKTQWKDFFRAIKKNFGRFFSLIFIVALGVAFYSGIRSTEPDMKKSADLTYDKYKFLDIWVRASLGLTNQDIDEIGKQEDVEVVEGGYLTEAFLTSSYGKDPNQEFVTQVYSTTSKLNDLNIKEGRLPREVNECLIDYEFMKRHGLKIGDSLKISNSEGKKDASLKSEEFIIAGSGSFASYLSWERGSSSIGDGSNDTFIFTSPEAFDLDYYTIAYVRVSGASSMDTYSSEYTNKIDGVKNNIEKLGDIQAVKRLNSIKEEVILKIEEARKKIDDGKQALKDGQAQLELAKEELDRGYREYYSGLARYNEGLNEYNSGIYKLKSTKESLESGENEYTSLQTQLKELEEQQKVLNASGNKEAIKALEGRINELKNKLQLIRTQLDRGWQELNLARDRLEVSRGKLEASKYTLDASKIKLDEGQLDFEKNRLEFEHIKTDREIEIAKAENDIKKAEENLNNIGESKWYVLTRNQIMTFVEFKMDSERIGKIGTVFPAIFFLVAALVCLTSMTRMIEEERTLIGTMKSMGFSSISIGSKYITYATVGTLSGGVLGALVGAKILPYVIILAYKILYVNLDVVSVPYHASLFMMSIAFALLATVGATIGAILNTLKSTPAALMRPPAPKSGKRIILERIPFIWNGLSFNFKSAIRNLFRYKKRFFMSVLGIGGCMSLLLVSFGLHDSIMTIVDKQYDSIWSYDALVDINQDASPEEKKELVNDIKKTAPNISNSLITYSLSTTLTHGNKQASVYIFVPEDKTGVSNFINFKDRNSKINNQYNLEDGEVIITEKVANLLDLKPLDELTLETDNGIRRVKISHISENYLYHYIYMTENTYKNIYGNLPSYNTLYLQFNTSNQEQNEELSKSILSMKNVKGIIMIDELQSKVNNMMSSLNYVVIVLVLSAGLLIYVVTYNLNNINISERRRELASLKVLGMHNIEVANYIYRENIFLTGFGIIAGLFMGLFLHQYVIRTAEIDMLMFGRHINITSYFLAGGLTLLFAIIVNALMFWRIKKIDVVESMKSVE